MASSNKNLIPAAIILAGLVLAVTVFMVRHEDAPEPLEGDLTKTLPVTETDHQLGDATPVITVVTYTDLDCQFCKRFHEVMEQIIAEYGSDGGVLWVVRHFPIIDLHPHAGSHAKAAECAAKAGGPATFWTFISALHASAPEGVQFNPSGYEALATGLGLSGPALSACATGSEFDDRVARDFENGLVIGAKGTPFSVVLSEGTEPFAVSGYLPYEGMKTVIDRALSAAR
jgi:protein-disulfide isomerase